MATSVYKLSPSDFSYLWEECKYCYYQKVKYGISHSGVFPSMFGRINSLLQNSIMQKNLQEIIPSLPSGIIEIQEGYIKSQPIPGAESCFLQGRFDILTRLEDDTYCVIDFKITKPDDEKIQKYGSQLHAYKYALENPNNGKEPLRISKMGVVSVNPESMELKEGKIIFTTTPNWHQVEENMESFFGMIKEISDVLKGPLPVPSKTCNLCAYRNNFTTNAPTTDDIPF